MTAVIDPIRGHWRRTYILGAAVIALNVYDAVVSRYLLNRGGSEGNPLMGLLIHTPWFWVVKLCIPAAVVYYHLRKNTVERTFNSFAFLTVLFVAVCIWNTSLLTWRYPS